MSVMIEIFQHHGMRRINTEVVQIQREFPAFHILRQWLVEVMQGIVTKILER